MSGPILNPDFQIPATSGIPGEAEDWIWDDSQAEGGWAPFNVAIPEYQRAREDFEAGWDGNQDWETSPVYAANIFNVGGGEYESAIESFEVWNGPPWKDVFTEIQTDFDPFDGASFRIPLESFDQGWMNDCIYDSWRSGNVRSGKIFGNVVEFPIVIRNSRSRLYLFDQMNNEIFEIPIVAQAYNDASSIVSELNNSLSLVYGATPRSFQFGSVTDDDGTRLWIGWAGVSSVSANVMFISPPRVENFSDARKDLGLYGVGFGGATGETKFRLGEVGAFPSEFSEDDIWDVDQWMQLQYLVNTDINKGGLFAQDYQWEAAVFDGLIDYTVVETFLLKEWFGVSAEWKTEYAPGDVVAAVFNDYDGGAPVTTESFETLWDDEPFPT